MTEFIVHRIEAIIEADGWHTMHQSGPPIYFIFKIIFGCVLIIICEQVVLKRECAKRTVASRYPVTFAKVQ